MNRATLFTITLVSALAFLASAAAQGQDKPTEDPNAAQLESLAASAQRFIDAFNQHDAAALAATYLPEGEILLRDGTIVSGREAITEFYDENFAEEDGGKTQAAIEAESVRFITPGVAIETGTLHITSADGVVTSHPYTSVQIKQADGTWLTGSVRDELGGGSLPSEKLLALEWLIGDWIIQQGDAETLLSFTWSDFGPYIEGSAETAVTYEGNVGLSTRIGWDGQRGGFISWGHDSEGGYVVSEWTETAPMTWLLRSKGVTSDGESNEFIQICKVEPNRQSFTWTIRDQTIDGDPQPDRVLTAVKRPPAPHLSAKPE